IEAWQFDNVVLPAAFFSLAPPMDRYSEKFRSLRREPAARANLFDTFGTGSERPENILASNDPDQAVVVVYHRNAPDLVLDHQLQHPGQPGIGADVDESSCHDIGDGPVHQI